MLPEPKPTPTPEVRSTADTASEPAAKVLKSKDPRHAAEITSDSRHETESALRIRAALRAARSDRHHGQPAEAPERAGTWMIKSLPRPPLVAAMLQEPPDDELLANDSLGG